MLVRKRLKEQAQVSACCILELLIFILCKTDDLEWRRLKEQAHVCACMLRREIW